MSAKSKNNNDQDKRRIGSVPVELDAAEKGTAPY
jgi:hypothetical protein